MQVDAGHLGKRHDRTLSGSQKRVAGQHRSAELFLVFSGEGCYLLHCRELLHRIAIEKHAMYKTAYPGWQSHVQAATCAAQWALHSVQGTVMFRYELTTSI